MVESVTSLIEGEDLLLWSGELSRQHVRVWWHWKHRRNCSGRRVQPIVSVMIIWSDGNSQFTSSWGRTAVSLTLIPMPTALASFGTTARSIGTASAPRWVTVTIGRLGTMSKMNCFSAPILWNALFTCAHLCLSFHRRYLLRLDLFDDVYLCRLEYALARLYVSAFSRRRHLLLLRYHNDVFRQGPFWNGSYYFWMKNPMTRTFLSALFRI